MSRQQPPNMQLHVGGVVVYGETAGGLRNFEDVRQIDCLDVVSCNKPLQAHRCVGRHDEAEKLTEEMCAGGSTPAE